MFDLIVVGGGAAGFFGAITAAEHFVGPANVLILEQGKRVLEKVRISGGGRCNLTHAEFDAKQLVKHYPRGNREMLGPFNHFGPADTMSWFEAHGVEVKVEQDNRVFPTSDNSASVIEALTGTAAALGIQLRSTSKVTQILVKEQHFILELANGERLSAKQVLLATGSSPNVYKWLHNLALPLVPPVPSLFSFNVNDKDLHALSGLSVPQAKLKLQGWPFITQGSLLITHWGLSGPAALKMSALAAIELAKSEYKTQFTVSWTGASFADMLSYLLSAKPKMGRSSLRSEPELQLPKRLWIYLVERAGLHLDLRWADLSRLHLEKIARTLSDDVYTMQGQTRFKEEFVTAGGVDLAAIDFKRFAVKAIPRLYIAGELLNIDGVTGGFNFQAAWTGGYLAGRSIALTASALES